MKKLIVKEVVIYLCLLIILAFMMHGSELPDRLSALTIASAWHPLVYSFVIYLVIAMIRFIAYKLKKLVFKSTDKSDS